MQPAPRIYNQICPTYNDCKYKSREECTKCLQFIDQVTPIELVPSDADMYQN